LLVAAVVAAGCASASPTAAPTTTSRPGLHVPPGPFTHVQLALEDRSRPTEDPQGLRNSRTRLLPTELYLPAGAAPRPLILFAHGLQGDPGKFTQLFEHWVRAGFVVVAPRFPLSATSADSTVARAGDIVHQPADMRFVLDRVLASRYARRIDAHRIGAAGLSLGGGTVWGLVTDRCCRDPRIRAAIVMDGNRFAFGPSTFVRNRVPVMVLHAEHDYLLPFDAARAAYAQLAPPRYFVTIFEAVHAQPYEDAPDPADDMVRRATVAFWRAYLLDDAPSRAEIVTTATDPGISTAEADTGR
jgi:predicted dienelactone hydrolase